MVTIIRASFLALCLHASSSSFRHHAAAAAAGHGAIDAPVIGILTVPTINGGCITVTGATVNDKMAGLPPDHHQLRHQEQQQLGSCFDSLYPDWIAAAGGRVVPIRYDAPAAELERLFGSVNGVLFTGGETDIRLLNSTYMRAAKQIFDLAVMAHASGDYVPLWGTCMGFQTLAVLAAGRADALTSRGVPAGNPGFDSDGINLPLRWAPNPRAGAGGLFWSRFAAGLAFANGWSPSPGGGALPSAADTPALRYLTTENITTNLHHDGVEPSSFERIKALRDFFDIVSTNRDLKGKEFVSTMEAASGAPIYGVQWHPERNAYRLRCIIVTIRICIG
eukprot:COSAG01_NODE_7570_length_3144_cov_2.131691_4_plen_335_part_00